MANFIKTPNMSLPNPVPGVDTGPDYANNIQASFNIIDGHNHTPGAGVPVPSAGININADLPFNGYNATLLRSARLSLLSAAIPSAVPDQGCLYAALVNGNYELFYNDTSANQVQLTLTGAVNATSSGISTGSDRAAFSGGVLTVQTTASVPLDISVQSVLLGNNSSSTDFMTLSAPASVTTQTITLPATPSAASFLGIDTSGNITAYVPEANGITRANLVPVGQQISSDCGDYNVVSGVPTAVTNLTVTITTYGNPVMLSLQSAGNGFTSNISLSSSGGAYISVQFFRGATGLGEQLLSVVGSTSWPASAISQMDFPTAGTYTYTLQAYYSGSASSATIFGNVLLAYELK